MIFPLFIFQSVFSLVLSSFVCCRFELCSFIIRHLAANSAHKYIYVYNYINSSYLPTSYDIFRQFSKGQTRCKRFINVEEAGSLITIQIKP